MGDGWQDGGKITTAAASTSWDLSTLLSPVIPHLSYSSPGQVSPFHPGITSSIPIRPVAYPCSSLAASCLLCLSQVHVREQIVYRKEKASGFTKCQSILLQIFHSKLTTEFAIAYLLQQPTNCKFDIINNTFAETELLSILPLAKLEQKILQEITIEGRMETVASFHSFVLFHQWYRTPKRPKREEDPWHWRSVPQFTKDVWWCKWNNLQ